MSTTDALLSRKHNLFESHIVEMKNTSGRGWDLALAYHNRSHVPTPPGTYTNTGEKLTARTPLISIGRQIKWASRGPHPRRFWNRDTAPSNQHWLFLGRKAAFDSVDRQALWQCLWSKSVSYKFLTLNANSRSRVNVYGKLSPEFTTSSGVRQGCPLSPLLFNFVIDTITEDSLSASNAYGVEVFPGPPLTDIEYADDIALLGSDPVAMQAILNGLNNSASRF
ncbi:hypothetical protein T265_09276 [Opisthorchis viverrini]|uniref:Reverse transcriptase domain-containing protein n=1 Tax=Opisthorchis viverrini TaxID=6198 RepID=A0A074ZAY0_OPIVI|nr:hypothetical protein T265_09276 [Opisthorchis viverrini]KER22687.1 hypothetical protein T265_09276 [Opisthorchis viverrini]